jgi:hypothetical protein
MSDAIYFNQEDISTHMLLPCYHFYGTLSSRQDIKYNLDHFEYNHWRAADCSIMGNTGHVNTTLLSCYAALATLNQL